MDEENKSGCEYWDVWILKFSPKSLIKGIKVKSLSKECCFSKDGELCPKCKVYYTK